MAIVAAMTIVTWVAATMLTKPEKSEVLMEFYKKIRPAGPGWKPIASQLPTVSSPDNLTLQIVAAVLATALVYTILPGIGYVIFKHWSKAGLCAVLTVVWAVPLAVIIRKLFPKEPAS